VQRPQAAHPFHHARDQVHQSVGLAGRHPIQVESENIDPKSGKDPLEKGFLLERKKVALPIVALARTAAQNDHPVASLLKSSEDQLRVNPATAGHLNDSKAGRISLPGPADSIGSFVRAPMTEKSDDEGLKIIHGHIMP
jgi:hypothetical protein